jgi:hypothetical protein
MIHHNCPLEYVDINCSINEGIGIIKYNCVFINKNEQVINPIHYMSLDNNVTINKVQMHIGEKIFESIIREKNKAKTEYMKAVDEGKRACLFEKISTNEYKLMVGNVEPNIQVNIIIIYTVILESSNTSAYKLVFPTNIAIKYSTDTDNISDQIYIGEISNMKYTNIITYDYRFNIDWKCINNIENVHINNENTVITHISKNHVNIKSNDSINYTDGDFVVNVKTNNKPTIYYQDDGVNTYAISSLLINISTSVQNNKNYTLMIDCSGSMYSQFGKNSKMKTAIDSALIFLSRLKESDYFNLVYFNSNFTPLWNFPVIANKQNIDTCINFINKLEANGGTELLESMSCAILNNFESKSIIKVQTNFEHEKLENIIILLTDGQICNKNKLFNSITEKYKLFEKFSHTKANIKADITEEQYANLPKTGLRIFTIGIGNDVDRHLIKEIAYITGGFYTCIADDIGKSFKLNNVINYICDTINNNYYKNCSLIYKDKVLSNQIDIVYPNKTYNFVFKISSDEFINIKNDLFLQCYCPKTNIIKKIAIKPETITSSDIVKQIYHNVEILILEHKLDYADNENYSNKSNLIIDEIIKISIENSIMSKYTSFIIIDNTEYTVDLTNKSVDVIVSHFNETNPDNQTQYAYNNTYTHECDHLEGGMDMFGGGSYRCPGTHIVYYKIKTDIDLNEIILQNNFCVGGTNFTVQDNLCYEFEEELLRDINKLNISINMYYNTIVFAKLYEKNIYENVQQIILQYLIVNFYLTPLSFFRIVKIYDNYITKLKTNDLRSKQVKCDGSCKSNITDY